MLTEVMGFFRVLAASLLLASFAPIPVEATPPSTPSGVVEIVYRTSLDHFGFDVENVKRLKPWIAPELYARMWKKVNEPTPPGDAPDIEGDLFLNCQDLPTRMTFGTASVDHDKASMEVHLFFDSEERTCSVKLEELHGAWKIRDVDFGKDGKLTDLL
jgi:hypothetical protein